MSLLEKMAELLRNAVRRLLGPRLVPVPVPVRISLPRVTVRGF